jgi:hypothetical protein
MKMIGRIRRYNDKYLFAVNILILFFTMGCYNESNYMGDGQLIDNGRDAATDRYVLDLGEIDLNNIGKYVFNIKGLPKEEFVIGIKLEAEQAIDIDSALPNDAEILVSLSEANGKIIFEVNSKLDDWIWSTNVLEKNNAFIYKRGDNNTFFNPDLKDYKLTVSILRPNQIAIPSKSKLLAKSGGWK